VAFLACVHLALILALSLSPRNSMMWRVKAAIGSILRSSCMCSDVNKTTRFKAKTKTEGHKTIGPITAYSIPTVNEIIFTAQYSITFAHYQLHNKIHTKV